MRAPPHIGLSTRFWSASPHVHRPFLRILRRAERSRRRSGAPGLGAGRDAQDRPDGHQGPAALCPRGRARARGRPGLGRCQPAAGRAPAAAPGGRRARDGRAGRGRANGARHGGGCAALHRPPRKLHRGRRGRAREERLRADRVRRKPAVRAPAQRAGSVFPLSAGAGAGRRRPHPSGRPLGRPLALGRAAGDAGGRTPGPQHRRAQPARPGRAAPDAPCRPARRRRPGGRQQPAGQRIGGAGRQLLASVGGLFRGRRGPPGAGRPVCQARGVPRAAAIHQPGAWRHDAVRAPGARPAVLLRAGAPRPGRSDAGPGRRAPRLGPAGTRAGRLRAAGLRPVRPGRAGAGAAARRVGQGELVGPGWRRFGAPEAQRGPTGPGGRIAGAPAPRQPAAGARAGQGGAAGPAFGPRALGRAGDGSGHCRAVSGGVVCRVSAAGRGLRRPAAGAGRTAGRRGRRASRGQPAALDGRAVPARERPPDHGHRGGRAACHAGRGGAAAGPVFPPAGRPQRARCGARAAGPDARRAVGARARPGGAGGRAHARARRCLARRGRRAGAGIRRHVRTTGRQPRRPGFSDRHPGLPAGPGAQAVRLRRSAGRIPLRGRARGCRHAGRACDAG